MSIAPIQAPERLMRARGKARMEKLLDAASELLASRPAEEVTYKDVYELAEVPPGSAYHFFDNIETVFAALLERYSIQMGDLFVSQFEPDEIPTWMELADKLIERAAAYYENNPAPRQILMAPKLPQGRISPADSRSGTMVEEAFDRYFMLPDMENRPQVFIFFTKIVNLIFSVAVTHHGTITEDLCEEAKTASKGYLKMYLPEKLLQKTPPEDPESPTLPQTDEA